ncbi:MAG TPA: hypothetical protein VHT73_13285, partial [Thermodesulfobacteriota bacterium]|nr:hypothetical protein [Thermodesulfobacteriota bacterium]
MINESLQGKNKFIIKRQHLQLLLDALGKRGYRIMGPTVGEGAIVYDELTSIDELPIGWTDEQDGGTYRLKRRSDKALFGYVVGPQSWKKFLHPPVMRLWRAKRNDKDFEIVEEKEDTPKYAFIGVRSCELHAIAVQDTVFMTGQYVNPSYKLRRENTFIVAVNCGQAGGTCFCVSMNTGPKATFGFDLALTEVLEDGRHYFVVEIGTDLGEEILNEVPHEEATGEEKETAEQIVERTATQMGRVMDTADILSYSSKRKFPYPFNHLRREAIFSYLDDVEEAENPWVGIVKFVREKYIDLIVMMTF